MGNIHKWTENIKTAYGKASAALGSETSDIITTTFVNMANYDLVTFTANVTNAASGKTVTLRLWEATAAAGTSSASLAITDTFTAEATSDTDLLVAQVRAAALSAGYQYVGAKVSTDDSSGGEIVGIQIHQLRSRYPQSSLP